VFTNVRKNKVETSYRTTVLPPTCHVKKLQCYAKKKKKDVLAFEEQSNGVALGEESQSSKQHHQPLAKVSLSSQIDLQNKTLLM